MPSKGSPRFKKYIKWFWAFIILPPLLLILLVAGTAKEWFGELPSFEELENPNSSISSEVYSADGVVLGTAGKKFISERKYFRN